MAEIGIVGLGKMGANMAERLRRAGHQVVGFDHDKDSSRDVANLGELVQALPTPRVVWVMVPAGEPTYATVRELRELLDQGDVMVDGGNSRYTGDQRHAEELAESGIGFVESTGEPGEQRLVTAREVDPVPQSRPLRTDDAVVGRQDGCRANLAPLDQGQVLVDAQLLTGGDRPDAVGQDQGIRTDQDRYGERTEQ